MKKRKPKPSDGTTLWRIRRHYELLGLAGGWTSPQVARLCRRLNCTLSELGALVCVTPRNMRNYMQLGKFPPPVSLHFLLLERALDEMVFGVKGRPVMPIWLLEDRT